VLLSTLVGAHNWSWKSLY